MPEDSATDTAPVMMLASHQTIAVVGLSSKPERPAYAVAAYMRKQGCRVIPVNPRETEICGERAYPDLESVPYAIDLVVVFRRSQEAGIVVDDAIRQGARGVWLQEGVIDAAAIDRARKAGLMAVMDRCWLKEHRRRSAAPCSESCGSGEGGT